MLLSALALSALAAVPTGAVAFRKPFVAVSATAEAHPERPGAIALRIFDRDVGCQPGPAARRARALTLDLDAVVGAEATGGAFVRSSGLGEPLTGRVVLERLPSELDERGLVTVNLAGKTDRIEGEFKFVVCGLLSAPVSSGSGGSRPQELWLAPLKLLVDVPATWVPREGEPVERRTWDGPDRRRRFALEASCPAPCDPARHAASAEAIAAELLAAHSGPGWTPTVAQNAAVEGKDAWVLRYDLAGNGIEPVGRVEVLRWGSGWPMLARCSGEAPVSDQALLDDLEAACRSMILIRAQKR